MWCCWLCRPPDEARSEADSALKPVTPQRLLSGTAESRDWLMYGGNYDNTRFSPLTDIDRSNVKKLSPAWVFQTGIPYQFQAAPIVADGMMYVSAAYNHVYALDAKTGELVWKYDHDMPSDARICCGPGNRGVAIADNTLYMGTLDARLVALDRRTGEVVWNVEIEKYHRGFSGTGAPLVVKDLVVVGIAGGDYGVRGFLDAYDAKTGERRWRRYTIPGEGEPGNDTWAGDSWKSGGGATWVTGSYDPDQDLLYWAAGNPGPDWNGDVREGDNLYSSSVLALSPETGQIQWHFQFTPHDIWDYDGKYRSAAGRRRSAAARRSRRSCSPTATAIYTCSTGRPGDYLHATKYVEQLKLGQGAGRGRPPDCRSPLCPDPGAAGDDLSGCGRRPERLGDRRLQPADGSAVCAGH